MNWCRLQQRTPWYEPYVVWLSNQMYLFTSSIDGDINKTMHFYFISVFVVVSNFQLIRNMVIWWDAAVTFEACIGGHVKGSILLCHYCLLKTNLMYFRWEISRLWCKFTYFFTWTTGWFSTDCSRWSFPVGFEDSRSLSLIKASNMERPFNVVGISYSTWLCTLLCYRLFYIYAHMPMSSSYCEQFYIQN